MKRVSVQVHNWPGILLIAALACACGGANDDRSPSAGGSGGTAGVDGGVGGASGAGASSTCAPTGTYNLTISRDMTSPGSCPNSLPHAENATATITAVGTGDYAMTLDSDAVCIETCTVNITGCKLTATCNQCAVIGGTGYSFNAIEEWTFVGDGLTGTEKWPAYPSKPSCSANWLVSGMRQ